MMEMGMEGAPGELSRNRQKATMADVGTEASYLLLGQGLFRTEPAEVTDGRGEPFEEREVD